jgi:hypothetical protein
MYYDNEFIDGLEQSDRLTLPKDQYVAIQAKNVAKMLEGNKLYYKQFGVYWWAVKDALRETLGESSKKKPWYVGKADDPLMKERAWHGSLFRTMLAAMYYMNEQYDFGSGCRWYDAGGEEHSYTLFDTDAGM